MEQQQQKSSSPLQFLLKKMESCEGGVKEIFIPDLLTGSESNVIVVDGSNFYGLYVYPNFDWVCGDLAALVDVIRRFVLAFENVGAKLVFFFVDGHIDEGKKKIGSKEWCSAHSEYSKYAINFYDTLKKFRHGIDRIKKLRAYYHSPFHAQSVVLYVLKHVLKCEINLVDAGYRNDTLAYYARNHKCCAVLVEDKLYLFYKDLPNNLSLRNLDLQSMKTKLYNPEVLPSYFRISEQHLYPLVVDLSETKTYSKVIIPELNRIIDKYKDKEFVLCNGRFCCLENKIDDRGHRDDYNKKEEEENEKKGNGQKLEEVTNKPIVKKDNLEKEKEEMEIKKEGNQQNEVEHDENFSYCDTDSEETDSDSDSDSDNDFDFDSIVSALKSSYICHNKGYTHYRLSGPFNEWRTIFLRAKELYSEGLISTRIKFLIHCRCFYNDSILEDFKEFPASSLIYQPLRKKMYSVLFHEDNQKSFKGIVKEYCMLNRGCRLMLVEVDPLEPNIKNMHLGLLKLWNLNDTSDEVMTAKWQLFSSCISFRLCNELQNLPPTLVIPTTVLFYLHQKVPRMFKNEKIMEPWEVDVFIVHFLMVPKISFDDLAKIHITTYNSRALKLMAMFVNGCLNMNLLVEVCGNFINKNDTCLLHYFNGKLFHDLYEKAEWRRKNLEHKLCDEESLKMFHKIKQIVSPV